MRRRVLLFLVVALSCKRVPDVGLAMTASDAIKKNAAWFEVGAFRDASCAALEPMLSNGVPDGYAARVAFQGKAAGPTFGELPSGSYAFAAAARDDQCGVIATGCSEVEVPGSDQIAIALEETADPTGKCGNGTTCQAGRCIPSTDSRDPTRGAGCSLELLGSGPLVNSTGGNGTLMSAPAIAATSSGFVIAYREIDSAASGARIVLLSIDASGGALKPEKPRLPNRCPNQEEIDGIGLVVKGDNGMVALAKPTCSTKPGLELLNFGPSQDDPGLSVPGKFYVSLSTSDAKVSLGSSRAAAYRPNGAVVVFTEGGAGRIANMDPNKGIVGPNGSFGGTSGITDTWIAATDKVLALLAAGRDGAAPVGDAGTDSGATVTATASTDLRLLLVPPTTAIDSIVAAENKPRAPIRFPGSWGSIAATGSRVVVLGEGSGPGSSVTYRAFDFGKSDEPADEGGYAVEGAGKVTSGDVALDAKRAYFAALKAGRISLDVYSKSTEKLAPLRSVAFASEPRIVGLNTIRDGRVAVALSDGRVAVAWTTAKVLNGNDPAGGYAVFACSD